MLIGSVDVVPRKREDVKDTLNSVRRETDGDRHHLSSVHLLVIIRDEGGVLKLYLKP
jgi:hypothetical protein